MTPEQVQEEALQVSKPFHSTDIHLLIKNTPVENMWKSVIRHRWNAETSEKLVVGNVTVAGDARHPLTPNLGQGGGSMALEDAIILTHKLHGALKRVNMAEQDHNEQERIHKALVEFQSERLERTYSIASASFNVGRVMQSGWTIIDSFRDWFFIPRALSKATFLTQMLFDVGELPKQI